MSAVSSSEKLTLSSDTFQVTFDPQTGTVQKLANTDGQDAMNFVLSAQQAPEFDIEDSRFLGDLTIRARRADRADGSTMTTGLSAATRSVSYKDERVEITYSGDSSNGGFNGVAVKQEYMLGGDSRQVLTWTQNISNISSTEVELEDLGFPIPMNACWGKDQTHNYERCVIRHSFIALYGSYIYWQTPNGTGPILVMTPGRGTSLEYKTRYGEDERFGENMPEWEGLTEIYVHSKHIGPARSARTRQYLPTTSRTLLPSQTCTYSFEFRFVENHGALHEALFEASGFDLISLPGMVVPTNMPITLAVRSASEISFVSSGQSDTSDITLLGLRGQYTLFKVSLTALGENHVTIVTEDQRLVVLQYFVIEPINQLIQKHSAFLARRQLAKSDHGYNGAFLQWDMSTRKLMTWHNYYPDDGWLEWMVGGSDDLGLAPGAFLSEACLISPNQEQIAALDYHIDNFLLSYLMGVRDASGKRTYQVYRWYDGQDGKPKDDGIWRAYNYTHIANLFFNMYRLRKAYSDFTMNRESIDYLKLAYEVLNAMYSKIPLPNPIGDAANTLGLMGESTVPEIINALWVEGFRCESAILQEYIDRKMQYYRDLKYPFASEQTIDTTGFESVYALSKAAGAIDLVEKCQKASIASRGLQPLWYYMGSDNRMMGEAYWNLGYETQLGAWQQQDYLVRYSKQDRCDFPDSMRSTYGAYLAGWANINSGQIDPHVENIGAAAWLWQSEGGKCAWPWMPMMGGWWAWSGEADLGFWGALRSASVNVVQDPVVGLFAYGGHVKFAEGQYCIEPKDGVQQRLTLFCLDNLTVRVERAQYTEANVAHDGSLIELKLTQAVSSPCVATLQLLNAVDGKYELIVSPSITGTVINVAKGDSGVIPLPNLPSTSSYTVTVRRI